MDKQLVQYPREVTSRADTPLPVLLTMATRVATTEMQTHLRELGYADLRPAHGFALVLVATRPHVTTAHIATHGGVTKQAAAQFATELEAGGYLERVPHPTDGRSTVLTPTAAGRRAATDITTYWRAQETRWAQAIGADQLDALRTALRHYLTAER